MEDKPHIENGEDAEFRRFLAQVLTHQIPKDALLDNRVFNRRLKLICRTIAYNEADADDLFAMVLFTIWQNLFEFEPDYGAPYGRFFAWVRVIARNKFCDDLRRKTLPLSDKRPEELSDLADQKISPERELERRRLDEDLQRFVSDLQDEKEHKLMKYYLAGNSFRSIANKMHEDGILCSNVTAKKIIRRLLDEFFRNKPTRFSVARKGEKPSGPHGEDGTPFRKTGS